MINFYSTGCPVCNQLKTLMNSKKIEYNLISNIDIILSIADKNNIMTAPFAEVDGKILNSNDLKEYLNTL